MVFRKLLLFFTFALVLLGQLMAGALDEVRSWGYYLSDIQPSLIAASPYDMMVMDPTRDGEEAGRFTAEDVMAMKQRQYQPPRLLMAYLSVGEAEDYRSYWQPQWKTGQPAWLDAENPDWPGNFKVRFWEPGWQKIIFGTASSSLDRILAAGFDGVYLDVLDAFEYYEERGRQQAADEMVEFVRRIQQYAKARKPGFVVIAQNAERLIGRPGFLDVIDAVAKEDLHFGQEREDEPTPAEDHAESVAFLDQARAAGKRIFTVDYVSDPAKRSQSEEHSLSRGYLPHFATRELDRLTLPDGQTASASTLKVPTETSRLFNRQRAAFFYSATVPAGSWRVVNRLEWSRYRFDYDFEDETTGDYRTFTADSLDEYLAAVDITYGFSDSFEAGLTIPTVLGRFSPDKSDRTGVYKGSVEQFGLGNIRLLSRYGVGWNSGSDFLLVSAEWGLPTDTRGDDFFGGYTDALLDVNFQHFWNHIGISLGGALDVYANDSFADTEKTLSWAVGLLGDISPTTFASATLTGRERGTLQLEGGIEFLLTNSTSIEFFGGVDLRGADDNAYAGIALTFVF
ncbi:MAG: endo alpha-1,4 polygalactosaminidase [Verrucomicrobiaceae bacterium]|nr:endo alpha-1,4 polygalactosaminidase [Verrucomicrobiaceae bacterium]